MDRIKTLIMEVRMNRIVIGSMLILFSISSPVSPLGIVAVIPLLGAIVVLSGILGWESIPELFERIKRWKINPHHTGRAVTKSRLIPLN
jgi:hypothetical protein